jgi:predicted  nucleic acid-binding Zn-ribbon protein
MTYAELMAKLAKGEPLTADEFQELGKLTRPTERFNDVSAKKADAEKELSDAKNKIAELEAAVTKAKQDTEDSFNERLGELTGRNEELTSELTELRASNKRNETLLKVNELARKNELGVVFKNPDYLAYRIEKDGIDLGDAEKVKTFLTGIKENEPEMCAVPVKGGAGSGGGDAGGSTPTPKAVKDWSLKEKVDFIKENGEAAYTELRNKEG